MNDKIENIVEEIKKDSLIIENKVKDEALIIENDIKIAEVFVKKEAEVIKEKISHSCAIALKNGSTIWTKIHNTEKELLDHVSDEEE